jgi:phosphopantetheine adenylyltransferase
MTMIVIYAGGFQPFHQGHLSSYIQAKSAFPNADFYVATSADVKNRPIPYEDKKFLAGEAGVDTTFNSRLIIKLVALK